MALAWAGQDLVKVRSASDGGGCLKVRKNWKNWNTALDRTLDRNVEIDRLSNENHIIFEISVSLCYSSCK
jgi:hypothetical protein